MPTPPIKSRGTRTWGMFALCLGVVGILLVIVSFIANADTPIYVRLIIGAVGGLIVVSAIGVFIWDRKT